MTDDERLEKLYEKAKQLYTVETVETEGNIKILAYEPIPLADTRIRTRKGEPGAALVRASYMEEDGSETRFHV